MYQCTSRNDGIVKFTDTLYNFSTQILITLKCISIILVYLIIRIAAEGNWIMNLVNRPLGNLHVPVRHTRTNIADRTRVPRVYNNTVPRIRMTKCYTCTFTAKFFSKSCDSRRMMDDYCRFQLGTQKSAELLTLECSGGAIFRINVIGRLLLKRADRHVNYKFDKRKK